MRQTAVRMYALLPIVPTRPPDADRLPPVLVAHPRPCRAASGSSTELAATAQLAALRAQINPHFLFNSLNSIAQLIHADPDKAEACVERLAEIFRYILRRAEKEFVPLAEELADGARPTSTSSARASATGCGSRRAIDPREPAASSIPNLILQPLVENAVKHGLSRKLGVGHGPHRRRASTTAASPLTRRRRRRSAWRRRRSPRSTSAASGSRNLRDRLARLYGRAHLPEITSAPGGGTAVRLRLPDRPSRPRDVTMTAIRTLVVDDEKLARDRLVGFLARLDGVELVGQADDGVEALAADRGASGPTSSSSTCRCRAWTASRC